MRFVFAQSNFKLNSSDNIHPPSSGMIGRRLKTPKIRFCMIKSFSIVCSMQKRAIKVIRFTHGPDSEIRILRNVVVLNSPPDIMLIPKGVKDIILGGFLVNARSADKCPNS